MKEFLFYVCDFERGCVAATKHAEEAAMLVGCLGQTATVQTKSGYLLWSQDLDGDAAESYDHAAEVMNNRLNSPLTLVVTVINGAKS